MFSQNDDDIYMKEGSQTFSCSKAKANIEAAAMAKPRCFH